MEGLKSFISGGVGGMSAVLVGHPLDTIKVRLQTSPPGAYAGTLDCAKQTIAKDGVRGLFRGMLSPLVGITPTFAVYFWGFDQGKLIARYAEGKADEEPLSTLGICFAGGFSALPGTVAMVPTDRVKVIMQIQGMTDGAPKYTGPWDCAKQVLKEDGIRGLYKGATITFLRDCPGSVAYYGAYEIMKSKLPGANDNLFKILFCGGMAGVLNWIVAVPMDTVKSRFQTAPEGTYPGGIRQVASDLIAKEGPMALYKGITPALLRAFPANAACFLGMEVSKKMLNWVF